MTSLKLIILSTILMWFCCIRTAHGSQDGSAGESLGDGGFQNGKTQTQHRHHIKVYDPNNNGWRIVEFQLAVQHAEETLIDTTPESNSNVNVQRLNEKKLKVFDPHTGSWIEKIFIV